MRLEAARHRIDATFWRVNFFIIIHKRPRSLADSNYVHYQLKCVPTETDCALGPRLSRPFVRVDSWPDRRRINLPARHRRRLSQEFQGNLQKNPLANVQGLIRRNFSGLKFDMAFSDSNDSSH